MIYKQHWVSDMNSDEETIDKRRTLQMSDAVNAMVVEGVYESR